MTFTTGHIARASGEVDNLTNLQGNEYTRDKQGHELKSAITFNNQIMDVSGDTIAISGQAARQELNSSQEVCPIDGDIQVTTQKRPEWKHTDFWAVKTTDGSDFVVAENSGGVFAFDLLENITGLEFTKVRFQLDDIRSDFPGQWVGGFEKRSGQVESGLLYGNEIEDDTEMGDPFRQTSNKNVIGPKISYRGNDLKLKIGRDGWVQVVKPGTYQRESYLRFVEDVMMSYSR